MMLDAASPDPLDLDHLARQTGDDRELEWEILGLFAGQCERLVPLILGPGPAPVRRDAAHTLKGAARAVGAWRLDAAAQAAEAPLARGETALDGDVAAILRAAADEAQVAARRQCASSRLPVSLGEDTPPLAKGESFA